MISREDWLNEARDLLLGEVLAPVVSIREDLKIKISVGFKPGSKAGLNPLFSGAIFEPRILSLKNMMIFSVLQRLTQTEKALLDNTPGETRSTVQL